MWGSWLAKRTTGRNVGVGLVDAPNTSATPMTRLLVLFVTSATPMTRLLVLFVTLLSSLLIC